MDDLIPISTNLVSGAHREGYHLLNVNYGRDYNADVIADITTVKKGDDCIVWNHPLQSIRGVEVGNIFKLGTHFSEAMSCYYLDKQGASHPVVMGSYGIGTGRLLTCIAEEHHDEHGLIWPITVAPYQIHLISLTSKSETSNGFKEYNADNLYQSLQNQQIECLFDDREESPGATQ